MADFSRIDCRCNGDCQTLGTCPARQPEPLGLTVNRVGVALPATSQHPSAMLGAFEAWAKATSGHAARPFDIYAAGWNAGTMRPAPPELLPCPYDVATAWEKYSATTPAKGVSLGEVFGVGYAYGQRNVTAASASINDPERDFIIDGQREIINDLINALRPFEGFLTEFATANRPTEYGKEPNNLQARELLKTIQRAKSIT